jgi:DNA-binding LacI/PurR family transcriptional regulator
MDTPNPRPTITDVARRAGVSIATVSRVLNGTAPVEASTAERVRAAINALKYVPHSAARMLASRRTETLGLLLPQISGSFFEPLLRGIEAGARQAGYDLLIHTTRSPRPENSDWRPLAEYNTDGLLVFTGSLDAQELGRLFGLGFPVVLLHQPPPPGIEIPLVTIENRIGARRVVEHLIEVHARRRIVFLKGPTGQEDSHLRELGYRDALRDHGLMLDLELVRDGSFDREVARRAIAQLLARGADFDAIFAGDDDSAAGALAALRYAGRGVPEQIAVAGFDDQFFAATLVPPLTTVRAPIEKVGEEAVRTLARIIQGQTVPLRLTLPSELVVRESCGCRTAT